VEDVDGVVESVRGGEVEEGRREVGGEGGGGGGVGKEEDGGGEGEE